MATNFSWLCPYCKMGATITDSNFSSDYHHFNEGNKDRDLIFVSTVIVCPNPSCKEYELRSSLFKSQHNGNRWVPTGQPLLTWNLKPRSMAKQFPTYIPKAIINDYEESCLILNDSPKASATLSRRCLQGIIRDYWGVSKSRLVDEINEIKDRVDPITWQAIDAVRGIGNIGAHMESDINLIIDVDPNEAQLLIGLIEVLIKDWYISREERKLHLQQIIDVAGAKAAQKKTPADK